MSHTGAQFGEIAQFLLRQVDLPKQRIGKDLVQLGKETVLVGGGEIAQIEVVGLRQTEQYLRRHRPLVPLYQVDIARGNPKTLGDLGLRQAELLATAAESRADEQFFSSIGGHEVTPGYRHELGSPRPACGELALPVALSMADLLNRLLQN